jgi:hypothetical protein
MTQLGIAITLATVSIIGVEFFRKWRHKLPPYGWVGLLLLLLAQWLLYRQVWVVQVYFTPIAWTAYLFIADSLVFAIAGRSRMRDAPKSLLLTAVVSIPLWLVFEAYNLRLANWAYVGLPTSHAAALLGYLWSFATITPAIFETADLIEAFGWFQPAQPLRFSDTAERAMIAIGVVCLILPIVTAAQIASYMFALVWVGFVLLLDPINRRFGLPSLLGDLAQGRRGRVYSLLLSGWICGWLWEFWNFWAAAKWHYTFPIFQHTKIFEMPLPGYLGFLPFALECFVMYVTAMSALEAFWRAVTHNKIPDSLRQR